MADPPADSPRALLDFLRRATSSPVDSLSLNAALALVKDALPPNAPLSIAQAPPAIPGLDADPLPSLLDSFAPVAAPSFTPATSSSSASTGALAWLQKSLIDDVRVAHAVEVLRSGNSDAEIQGELLDIWGFEGIEDVAEAVRRRAEIVAEAAAEGGRPQMNGLSHDLPPHIDSHPSHPASILSAHARDYTPGSQLSFATAEEVQAAKLAKKAHKREKGKGRADGDGLDGSPDVQEWMRIREEQLARGPGALVSGRRVRHLLLHLSCALTEPSHLPAGYRGRTAVSERLYGVEECGRQRRWSTTGTASGDDAGDEGGAPEACSLRVLTLELTKFCAAVRGDHHTST